MERKIAVSAAILGMTAILLGAFGAHALKEVLSIEQLNAFDTGVKYQMFHALFLLFISQANAISENAKKTIFYLTILGILFFSGSIYILTTKNITGLDIKAIGIITPIGGLLLIVAWLCLFIDFIKKKV